MNEIAHRLGQIIDRYGAQSVATYSGTVPAINSVTMPVVRAFHQAIGSPSLYTSATIDQPGKVIAASLHGTWEAGPQVFEKSDVWLLAGANPLVSMWGGIPQFNPWRRLYEAKARGLKLVVVDPKVTEVARQADVHLQIRPGEDATLFAAMLRIILEEALHDEESCLANVTKVDALSLTRSESAGASGWPASAVRSKKSCVFIV